MHSDTLLDKICGGLSYLQKAPLQWKEAIAKSQKSGAVTAEQIQILERVSVPRPLPDVTTESLLAVVSKCLERDAGEEGTAGEEGKGEISNVQEGKGGGRESSEGGKGTVGLVRASLLDKACEELLKPAKTEEHGGNSSEEPAKGTGVTEETTDEFKERCRTVLSRKKPQQQNKRVGLPQEGNQTGEKAPGPDAPTAGEGETETEQASELPSVYRFVLPSALLLSEGGEGTPEEKDNAVQTGTALLLLVFLSVCAGEKEKAQAEGGEVAALLEGSLEPLLKHLKTAREIGLACIPESSPDGEGRVKVLLALSKEKGWTQTEPKIRRIVPPPPHSHSSPATVTMRSSHLLTLARTIHTARLPKDDRYRLLEGTRPKHLRVPPKHTRCDALSEPLRHKVRVTQSILEEFNQQAYGMSFQKRREIARAFLQEQGGDEFSPEALLFADSRFDWTTAAMMQRKGGEGKEGGMRLSPALREKEEVDLSAVRAFIRHNDANRDNRTEESDLREVVIKGRLPFDSGALTRLFDEIRMRREPGAQSRTGVMADEVAAAIRYRKKWEGTVVLSLTHAPLGVNEKGARGGGAVESGSCRVSFMELDAVVQSLAGLFPSVLPLLKSIQEEFPLPRGAESLYTEGGNRAEWNNYAGRTQAAEAVSAKLRRLDAFFSSLSKSISASADAELEFPHISPREAIDIANSAPFLWLLDQTVPSSSPPRTGRKKFRGRGANDTLAFAHQDGVTTLAALQGTNALLSDAASPVSSDLPCTEPTSRGPPNNQTETEGAVGEGEQETGEGAEEKVEEPNPQDGTSTGPPADASADGAKQPKEGEAEEGEGERSPTEGKETKTEGGDPTEPLPKCADQNSKSEMFKSGQTASNVTPLAIREADIPVTDRSRPSATDGSPGNQEKLLRVFQGASVSISFSTASAQHRWIFPLREVRPKWLMLIKACDIHPLYWRPAKSGRSKKEPKPLNTENYARELKGVHPRYTTGPAKAPVLIKETLRPQDQYPAERDWWEVGDDNGKGRPPGNRKPLDNRAEDPKNPEFTMSRAMAVRTDKAGKQEAEVGVTAVAGASSLPAHLTALLESATSPKADATTEPSPTASTSTGPHRLTFKSRQAFDLSVVETQTRRSNALGPPSLRQKRGTSAGAKGATRQGDRTAPVGAVAERNRGRRVPLGGDPWAHEIVDSGPYANCRGPSSLNSKSLFPDFPSSLYCNERDRDLATRLPRHTRLDREKDFNATVKQPPLEALKREAAGGHRSIVGKYPQTMSQADGALRDPPKREPPFNRGPFDTVVDPKTFLGRWPIQELDKKPLYEHFDFMAKEYELDKRGRKLLAGKLKYLTPSEFKANNQEVGTGKTLRDVIWLVADMKMSHPFRDHGYQLEPVDMVTATRPLGSQTLDKRVPLAPDLIQTQEALMNGTLRRG